MAKRYFNTTGLCEPKRHYMVDIQGRLEEIKKMVDDGAYFTINRARQYGKTTLLNGLAEYLKKDYVVFSLDFQMIGSGDFADETKFVNAFADFFLEVVQENDRIESAIPSSVLGEFEQEFSDGKISGLRILFRYLKKLCAASAKPVVLLIDEVDSASNNQVFLDFLAQLRAYYLARTGKGTPTFQSVILAGVHDVKNIRGKIRPEEHRINSPWNIAADFKVDLSFSKEDIAGMLREYEADYHTGMDVEEIAGLLYDYTSGYPFLVSRLCKLIDEDVAGSGQFTDKAKAWTKEGFLEAEKRLLSEKNTLFESLMGKLNNYPDLKHKIYSILFSGERIVFNPFDMSVDMAVMFGFVKNVENSLAVANRIFEIILYDYFTTDTDSQNSGIFQAASREKSQFLHGGRLDMNHVLEKFVEHYDLIYGDDTEKIDEEEGRRRFLLYLRPIINGSGNYYVEARTRNSRRMDVVVDYGAEQFIVELKIWRGNSYNERGEKQLSDYLDYFHLKKGYMLSYNHNKKKKIGLKEIRIGDRVLVEAMV